MQGLIRFFAGTKGDADKLPIEEQIPALTLLSFIWCHTLCSVFNWMGQFYDWIHDYFYPNAPTSLVYVKPGYAGLAPWKDYFFFRRYFWRIRCLWERPVLNAPGSTIKVQLREGQGLACVESYSLSPIDQHVDVVNLASYNYLGFADGSCNSDVESAIHSFGTCSSSPAMELGQTILHKQLEQEFATFIGKEESIIYSMGYATNSTTIPALIYPGDLVFSDSLNHASIVAGCRSSGATIRVFRHNDPQDLEDMIRVAISLGNPKKSGAPWNKILIIVEGIYSMEGEILRLAEIVQVKKKYNCYLYVDEAHSIGALGDHARGICDHTGVDTADVDILMGTFTKSFGSMGGYIAANKDLIHFIRTNAFSPVYAGSMTPGCVEQIRAALREIQSDKGKKRIVALRENSNYFRRRLLEKGFKVIGDMNSPVVPMMIFHPLKMTEFSRESLKRGVATVGVGPPVTGVNGSRARFCISASLSREDLDRAIGVVEEIGELLLCRYVDDNGKALEQHKVEEMIKEKVNPVPKRNE
eukprot:TRINITY_DN60_c0_g1_i1.p1 TRINITY_DN60_c0_g1~~TRINITY_DN60_c0_g1_i1.p1  ORF type:complete len:527 (+),score=111.65 TRINITY_DN60_c0_g1_i1:156-1736(+)